MKSWKTTLAGAAVIVAACLGMKFGSVDTVSGSALVVVGIGLIMSRDNDVTSSQLGLTTSQGYAAPPHVPHDPPVLP